MSAGAVTHGYTSVFLLDGGSRTMLIDTGRPKEWDAIDAQLNAILGARQLDVIFPTHAEYVHMGNLARLLEKYPAAVAAGDLTGYHLYFPGYESRFRNVAAGETMDFGDLACRFHWLSACRPERVENALRRVFAERPVRVIAPSHGCVVRGDATVEDQYGRVLDALQGMRGGPDLVQPQQ